jgi:hypothetical protein
MAHYSLPAPALPASSSGSSSSLPTGSSPFTNTSSAQQQQQQQAAAGGTSPHLVSGVATSSGLLSPQQQLIFQLEQAAMSSSHPSSSVISGSYNITNPSLSALAGLPEPLSIIDVRDCSAIEGIVLVMSWLAELVAQHATYLALPATNALTIVTGGAGPASAADIANLVLFQPVPKPPAQQQTSKPGGSLTERDAALGNSTKSSSGTDAEGCPLPAARSASSLSAGAAILTGGSCSSSEPVSSAIMIPGGSNHVSVHAAVVALLGGNMLRFMACENAMDLLVPFSSAGQLPLGLLCCSTLPVVLPEAHQGGGVLLPVQELSAAISAALVASRA